MPIYMNYSGVSGESQSVASHEQWIEISSFQWGVGRGISSPTGGSSDREGSSPSVSQIVITKATDAASPNLLQECLGGRRLRVSIVFTKATTPNGPRHKLDLKDALIADIQPHPRRSGSDEKLTITFSDYHFNGAKNVPIPPTLSVNEGNPVRSQEIWTPFRLTPGQIH